MELVLQQMPIVVHSLNIGFLQTLRLFFELFYKSDRMDRAWYAADDSASDHLLFPRAGSWKDDLGRRRDRTFYGGCCILYF